MTHAHSKTPAKHADKVVWYKYRLLDSKIGSDCLYGVTLTAEQRVDRKRGALGIKNHPR